MLDPENGANPLTVHGGHFLDTLFSLGEFEELAARTATSIPEVTIRYTGETIGDRRAARQRSARTPGSSGSASCLAGRCRSAR